MYMCFCDNVNCEQHYIINFYHVKLHFLTENYNLNSKEKIDKTLISSISSYCLSVRLPFYPSAITTICFKIAWRYHAKIIKTSRWYK